MHTVRMKRSHAVTDSVSVVSACAPRNRLMYDVQPKDTTATKGMRAHMGHTEKLKRKAGTHTDQHAIRSCFQLLAYLCTPRRQHPQAYTGTSVVGVSVPTSAETQPAHTTCATKTGRTHCERPWLGGCPKTLALSM